MVTRRHSHLVMDGRPTIHDVAGNSMTEVALAPPAVGGCAKRDHDGGWQGRSGSTAVGINRPARRTAKFAAWRAQRLARISHNRTCAEDGSSGFVAKPV